MRRGLLRCDRTAKATPSGPTPTASGCRFVMPFISTILGYDVFDPLEVVPEFTADVGTKRGEKVDYAIMRDGEVQILVECKKSTGPLRVENVSQLFRYFSVTNARIAVLTNGQVNDRLKTALSASYAAPAGTAAPADAITSQPVAERDIDRDTEITTTLEELEGYQIVKAIACSEVKPDRAVIWDSRGC
ncbi:hypothetical protein CryarDRAFT_0505 [Cryptosporangium arvum DSM 44712]|uniref:Type I restriction enzyme R protein N-terminal domain-containing protein n=1 Tax=Cryptosporangium arvum DSM 44712 TaxID=927661 RepID=A0A010ZQI0_9ACTN|nr:hypothetical protein CryarDRAFT_0505 [Cryptosporangium arvum DSM 44712]